MIKNRSAFNYFLHCISAFYNYKNSPLINDKLTVFYVETDDFSIEFAKRTENRPEKKKSLN